MHVDVVVASASAATRAVPDLFAADVQMCVECRQKVWLMHQEAC